MDTETYPGGSHVIVDDGPGGVAGGGGGGGASEEVETERTTLLGQSMLASQRPGKLYIPILYSLCVPFPVGNCVFVMFSLPVCTPCSLFYQFSVP